MFIKLRLLVALLFCLFTRPSLANEPDHTNGEWGILFTLANSDTEGLYWMNLDGSAPELMLNYADFINTYLSKPRANISPDGQRIAFSSIITMSPYFRFTVYDRKSQVMTRLSHDDVYRKGFYWSPDSQQLAYLTETWGGKLYLINLESGEEIPIASTYDLSTRGGSSYFVSLDWSPDGKRIAVSYLQENGLTSVNDLTIVLLNADGSGFHRALKKEDWGFAPSWGNNTILYYICPAKSGRLLQLCALDIERSLTVQVRDFSETLPEHGFIKTLDVAPDERMLLSFDDGTGKDQIYLYDIDSDELINLSQKTGVTGSYPQWFYH